ncbi:Serine/threonine protein kinase [Entamoeba marina]
MLEYAEYGSLDNVKHLIEHHVLYKIMEDVCKALKYLHVDKKVIHRDIKPQNILIFNYHEICDVNAKLTDFGTSEMISSEGNFGKFGTDNFMAPEVVKGKNYTNKCDIYSLGITMLSSFLKIGFENATSNTPQKNGTYIKTTANLKADIGQLIIRCCQIDPLKRPDIDECLKSIQEIIKNFGDKDVFESINTEQEDVRFAIPKFSLFSFVKEVVKSIKELKVTNDFIKGKLMLKFKKDTLKAYTLINQNRSSLDNKGDVDYAKARNYLEAKKTDLTIVGNNLMISAAEKSHPDAIMHLIDILIDIDRGKLKIYDYEKHRIRKIVKDTFSMNPFLYGAFPVPLPLILQKLFYTKISAAVVMNIFSVLRKYIPLCELYYGIALLRGVGIKRSISNAEPLFNSFKRSEYCRDKLEVQFYQVYCTCIRNNIQEINKEAYNMLDECIAQSKNQRYYSDALNNKGVLLYNGLGCDSDIKKAFEYFKQSMELNNDYGKFNYALCLRNHEELLTSSLTNKDGLKIIQTLAKQDFSEAQRFCAIAKFQEWSNNNADSSFFEAIHWRARASLQLDYHSIYSFGKLLDEWNLGKKKGDKEKLKEFAFTLYNIASQSGYLKAQIELIKCYKCGRGTKKNLEEARNWCIKALDGNKNDEEDREYGASKTLKSTVEYHYLIIVKEMCTENKDSKVTEEALDLIKTLENTTYNKTLFELGMCYFDGVIVSNDKQKAIDFFERAVKENNKKAFYRLGVEYLCGTCIEKDEKKGVEYLLSASKEGVQEAIEYLENSEDILDLNSLYSIGSIYLKGADPIKKDFDKAIKYLIKAAHYNNIHIHQPIYPTFPQPNDVKPPKIPESNQESPQYADPDYPVYVEPYYVGTLTPNNGRAYLILCDTYLGEGRVPKNFNKASYYFNKALESGNTNTIQFKKKRPMFCKACNF